MPAFIDENPQFIDPDTSSPIVNGSVFYGVQGENPSAVRITVFADRALTIPVAQPIKTDASGRTIPTPLFIPSKYSYKVLDQFGVQKLINLDAGVTEVLGTLRLISVVGGNNITAQSDPPTVVYQNGAKFTFTAVSINTAAMTLDVGPGPKSIMFNFNEIMKPGFIQAGQTVNLTFNSTTDNFDWSNAGRATSILTNVAGTADAITADGGPSITGLVDQQLFSLIPNSNNTAGVTLKVGDLSARGVRSKGADLPANALVQNIPALLAYNNAETVFELLNFTSGIRAFTSFIADGTWTRNLATKTALIFCIGSGGGGAGTQTSGVGGGGGGSGGLSIAYVTSFTGPSDVVDVGSFGNGGAVNGGGGAGGVVRVGALNSELCRANGGGGATVGGTGGGGAGSTDAVGDIIILGADGSRPGSSLTTGSPTGGTGGGSFLGSGGAGGAGGGGAGAVATVLGSGGGGAGGTNTTTGGSGKAGLVFILEFG